MGRRKHGCLPGQRTGLRSEFSGPFSSLGCRKGDPGSRIGSSALAGVPRPGQTLEIKVKAPCCCPEATASEGLLTACNQRTREEVVEEVSHKTLSFHGGAGGCSFNEVDHNPRLNPLYRTFPHQRKQRTEVPPPLFSLPSLTQAESNHVKYF